MNPSPALNIPQTVQLLSYFSDDISPFYTPPAPRLPWQKDPLDPLIPKLLDALLFFLQTDAENRKISAVTLAVNNKEAILTLASNVTQQDADSSDTSSSQVILGTIWKYMVAYTTSRVRDSREQSQQAYKQLVTYLLRTHFPLILRHFNERCEQYQRFSQTFQQPDVVLMTNGKLKNYLQTVDIIHTATEKFCSVLLDQESIMKFLEVLSDHTAFQAAKPSVCYLDRLVAIQRQVCTSGE